MPETPLQRRLRLQQEREAAAVAVLAAPMEERPPGPTDDQLAAAAEAFEDAKRAAAACGPNPAELADTAEQPGLEDHLQKTFRKWSKETNPTGYLPQWEDMVKAAAPGKDVAPPSMEMIKQNLPFMPTGDNREPEGGVAWDPDRHSLFHGQDGLQVCDGVRAAVTCDRSVSGFRPGEHDRLLLQVRTDECGRLYTNDSDCLEAMGWYDAEVRLELLVAPAWRKLLLMLSEGMTVRLTCKSPEADSFISAFLDHCDIGLKEDLVDDLMFMELQLCNVIPVVELKPGLSKEVRVRGDGKLNPLDYFECQIRWSASEQPRLGSECAFWSGHVLPMPSVGLPEEVSCCAASMLRGEVAAIIQAGRQTHIMALDQMRRVEKLNGGCWIKRALLVDDLDRLEPLLERGQGIHLNDDEAQVSVSVMCRSCHTQLTILEGQCMFQLGEDMRWTVALISMYEGEYSVFTIPGEDAGPMIEVLGQYLGPVADMEEVTKVEFEIRVLAVHPAPLKSSMVLNERVEYARQLKERANRLYSGETESHWEAAQLKYLRMIYLLDDTNPPDFMLLPVEEFVKCEGQLQQSDVESTEDLWNSAHLNAAAAAIKLEDWNGAVALCNSVLKNCPTHIKALYRVAQAKLGAQNLVEATGVLTKLLELDPTNKAAHRLLEVVKREQLAADRNDAKCLNGMFSKMEKKGGLYSRKEAEERRAQAELEKDRQHHIREELNVKAAAAQHKQLADRNHVLKRQGVPVDTTGGATEVLPELDPHHEAWLREMEETAALEGLNQDQITHRYKEFQRKEQAMIKSMMTSEELERMSSAVKKQSSQAQLRAIYSEIRAEVIARGSGSNSSV